MTSIETHEPAPAYDRDEEHLKLLGIAHYVIAALELLGCGAGAVYVAMAFFVPAAIEQSGDPNVPPELVGSIGVVLGTVGVGIAVFSLVMSGLTAYAGWSLHNCRNRILILVVSALHLLSMPFGTILGVLTIIVMSRPAVTTRFERAR
jgi:hypothetical protein